MIIKELEASFGKLSHHELSLKEGLNIIYAPNESGKSTWCAFIRAMLYGIDTSQRDKIGFLSDKTRYRPWSGAAMEGTMVVSSGGRSISIQRTAQGSAPMRRLKAVYTDNGELAADASGEMLTGASEEIFSRTAFIGQTGIKVSQSADLERKISGIISSGNEDTSYSQIDSRMRAWQRKLRYNKTGELPALEQDLAVAEKKLSTLEMANDRLADLKNELHRLEEKEVQLKTDLETHKKLEVRATKRRVLDARKAAENSKRKADELRRNVSVDDRIITREEITKLRGEIASLEMLKIMASDSYATLEKAREENYNARLLLSQCSIKDKEPGYVTERAGKAEEYEKAIREKSSKKGPKLLKSALAALAAVGGIAALTALFALDNKAIAIAGLGVCVISSAALLFLPKTDRGIRAARDEILSEFNMLTVSELSNAARDYAGLSMQVDGTEIGVTAADAAFKAAMDKADQASADLLSAGRKLFPQLKRVEELPSILTRTEENLSQLAKAEFNSTANSNIYNVLLESYNGDPDEDDDDFLTTPLRDPEGTKVMLDKTAASARELRQRYDLAQGTIRAMGDPAILNGEIREITRQIEELKARYDALTLAIQTLKDADSELQTRFSPVISRIAGEYMNRLTMGRYEKLLFDKSFDAMAKTNEDSVSRNVLSLSQGTADQLYLSLRLAMCELMLSGKEPCPIILDDALVSFDDERMASALELLLELSEKRQIILFSCHSREADYFKGHEKVNIIRTKRR